MPEEIKQNTEEKKEVKETVIKPLGGVVVKVNEEKKEETKEIVKIPEELDGKAIIRDDKGRFVEGHSPQGGRPKGSKDFNTILKQAFIKIAETKKDLDPDSIEVKMVMRAVGEALNGDFKYFQYLTDRKYGKPKTVFEGLKVDSIHFNIVKTKDDIEKLNKEDEDTGEGNNGISKES